MTAITIELQNENDLDLVLKLAKRINAKILNLNSKSTTNSFSPIDLLEKLAKSGGVKNISDPSLWQSEIRKDTTLFGRE
jgi:hypothetical protein